MTSRTRTGVILGLVAVAAPGLLWWMSTASVSPEQRIADAEPPPEPVVTAEIEERELEDVMVFRGSVVAVGDLEVHGPDLEDASPVVIDVPLRVGDEVDRGSVVAVVADRPIIAVQMSVPLYRRLMPGVEGHDVARLQDALGELGYATPDGERGRFGAETQDAVRELYSDLDHTPVPTSPEVADAAAAAEDAHREATDALDDAKAALNQQRAALQRAREQQQEAANSASAPAGTDELEDAVGDAERAVERAQAGVESAAKARDAAVDEVGVTVPVGEIVGVPRLPAVVSAVTARPGDLVAEQPILTIATAELEVHATVEPSAASLLTPGTDATAGDDAWPLEVVSNDTRTEDGDPFVQLQPGTELPADALGSDLRIEARLGGTDGPVLALPVTAIRTDADGDHVRVVSSEETLERVAVTTGASLGGWVELVDPPSGLTPGTAVRLG